ncbi:MAG: hypothetical protein Q4G63_01825 [Bacteroidia bacterium]|nr:hypothetical protein [Bacteroidia bacterium]
MNKVLKGRFNFSIHHSIFLSSYPALSGLGFDGDFSFNVSTLG